ncbi:hypothetical protein [Halorubrum vacuolatum]|uniref:hypothetical protein n=1 Tax=Halorubrum vacuolatum TaxID=63740 RepID=UPI0015C5FF72|nr:hypothetical protein [Halorubrum vacuolatum]
MQEVVFSRPRVEGVNRHAPYSVYLDVVARARCIDAEDLAEREQELSDGQPAAAD